MFVVSIACILLVGGLAVIYATSRLGIDRFPGDSFFYVGASRSILQGNWALERRFAPFYPIILTVIPGTTANVINVAPVVNILFLIGTALVAVGILRKMMPDSIVFPVLGALFIVIAPDTFENYLMAMSETVYIFFTYLSLFLLALYLEKPRTWMLSALI